MDLFLIKLVLSFLLAWGLVWLAEKRSVRLAGLISSLPNVSLVVMFFIGVEQGCAFSSVASLFGVVGLAGNILWAVTAILLMDRIKSVYNAMAIAVLAYLVLAMAAVYGMAQSIFIALTVLFSIYAIGLYSLRKVPTARIEQIQKTTWLQLFVKFVLIFSVIIFTTKIAPLIGAKWSGFFGTIPAVTLPIAITIAWKYPRSVLQHFLHSAVYSWLPTGLYFAVIYVLYPKWGIAMGTFGGAIMAFAAAIPLFLLKPKILESN